MSWKDKYLREGSYRGATFFVKSHALRGGNRTAVHEFLQRPDPFVEQFGASPRQHVLSGYVLEDAEEDYFAKRDRLLAALQFQDKQGARSDPSLAGGVLVHPYLGTLRAALVSFRLTEDVREGRIARFSMAFIETPKGAGFPSSTPNSPGVELQAAADELEQAAGAAVAEELVTSGPAAVRESTASSLRQLSSQIAGLNVFHAPAGEVSAFGREVQNLASSAASLAVAPASLASTVLQTLAAIPRAVSNARSSLFAYEALFGFGASDHGADPASSNARSMAQLVRSLAAVGFARSALRVGWEFRGEAVRARDALLREVDAISAGADNLTLESLASLRALAVEALPPPGEGLADLVEITLAEPTSCVALSFRLYGTPDRSLELERRTRAPEPGFLPAGQPLEVLGA